MYGETCPHYIAPLIKDDDFGALGKMSPPLRGRDDCERLWQGIREGMIVMAGSDYNCGQGGRCHKESEEFQLGIREAGCGRLACRVQSRSIDQRSCLFTPLAN